MTQEITLTRYINASGDKALPGDENAVAIDITYIVDGEYPDGKYKKKVKDTEWILNGITYLITGDWPDGGYLQQVKEKGDAKTTNEIISEKKEKDKEKVSGILTGVDILDPKDKDITSILIALLCLILEVEQAELEALIAGV